MKAGQQQIVTAETSRKNPNFPGSLHSSLPVMKKGLLICTAQNALKP